MGTVNFNWNECIKKYSPSERKEIIKAFEKLKNMIAIKEQYGLPFEKIFNNESLKYDVLGKGFYTFKAHGEIRHRFGFYINLLEKQCKILN